MTIWIMIPDSVRVFFNTVLYSPLSKQRGVLCLSFCLWCNSGCTLRRKIACGFCYSFDLVSAYNLGVHVESNGRQTSHCGRVYKIRHLPYRNICDVRGAFCWGGRRTDSDPGLYRRSVGREVGKSSSRGFLHTRARSTDLARVSLAG